MKVAEPIIEKIKDNIDELENFKQRMSKLKDDKRKHIIMDYPTVYIHSWKNKKDYEVYVGESNNVFERTKQHYNKMSNNKEWQHNFKKKNANLYIIGHKHFNKSITMDIETKLIHYLTSVENVKKVHNGRDNPQKCYYMCEELEDILAKIWNNLRKDNKELFLSTAIIKDLAIFKASPLHKLKQEQQEAKEKILEKINNALKNKKRGQLIFVEGEAGTGKTVLNSSTFYELFCRYEDAKNNKEDLQYDAKNCFLLVNNNEQIKVYKQIFNKLGIIDQYGQIIKKPTTFINSHTVNNPVDIVFIDEAHLLLTQGKQSYKGKNQLKDIIDRAKIVIVMFDEDQILNAEQYWEYEKLQKIRNNAIINDNYIKLENQLRIQASEEVIDWINSFTKDRVIKNMPHDLGKYDIKILDTPKELEKEIKKKVSKKNSKLSRIIATYDWPYVEKDHKKCPDKYWEVKIGNWHKPWNKELEKEIKNDSNLNEREKRDIEKLTWTEQPQTIDEVGSTYTIQGFDLNYAGVILGPSVKYRNGHIIFDPNESCNEKATRNRTLSDGTSQKFGEELLRHEVRVLMTRGVNGLYIYACDDELRAQLKKCTKNII